MVKAASPPMSSRSVSETSDGVTTAVVAVSVAACVLPATVTELAVTVPVVSSVVCDVMAWAVSGCATVTPVPATVTTAVALASARITLPSVPLPVLAPGFRTRSPPSSPEVAPAWPAMMKSAPAPDDAARCSVNAESSPTLTTLGLPGGPKSSGVVTDVVATNAGAVAELVAVTVPAVIEPNVSIVEEPASMAPVVSWTPTLTRDSSADSSIWPNA